jgi:NAD(P)-dependent dehydrogenase (short-subunit alcohol dehydrogenase family)
MRGKTVLVTGANSGVGFIAARELATAGALVVMLVRDRGRGESAQERISASEPSASTELLVADLADFSAVRRAASEFLAAHAALDVLIANAGAIYPRRTVTVDGNEATFQVNHLSHFLLCALLQPALAAAAPARVISVSSDAHYAAWRGIRFEDLGAERGWSPFGAYAHSKLANIMFCYEHARRLGGTPITSNVVHPGLIRTGFGREGYGWYGRFIERLSPAVAGTAEEGADTVVWLAVASEVAATSGAYFHRRRPHRSSPTSRNAAAQGRLWRVSEVLTGLRDEPGLPTAADRP